MINFNNYFVVEIDFLEKAGIFPQKVFITEGEEEI